MAYLKGFYDLPILISVAALIISMISVVVAVLGWRRQRNIYDIERFLFFRKGQIDKVNNNESLKNKLSSGDYTILHTGEYGGYVEVFLGRIKR